MCDHKIKKFYQTKEESNFMSLLLIKITTEKIGFL